MAIVQTGWWKSYKLIIDYVASNPGRNTQVSRLHSVIKCILLKYIDKSDVNSL